MKALLLPLAACVIASAPCLSEAATTMVQGQLVNTLVPDNNASGVASTITVAGGGQMVTSVEVELRTNGGWNGDLYVYLEHNGVIGMLLNRPGRSAANPAGAASSGMNLHFADSALADIHTAITGIAGALAGGSYQPDARAADPGLVTDTSLRILYLSGFQGQNADGDWTLFIADVSAGDVTTVTDWSLSVTVVPEPSAAVLLLAGLMPLLFRRRRHPRACLLSNP